MAQSKRFRRLCKALKPYGLRVKKCGGHNGIFNGDRRIYTFSGSPASIHYAEHNTFHDLKKMGYIPRSDRTI